MTDIHTWIELASAVGEFAQTVSDIAASDLGKSLSHSLEALDELERKAQETESAQARADQATLLSTADEYARLVNSVRVSAITAIIREPRMLTWYYPHRWPSVRVCECTMLGRMQKQSSAASSRHTSAIAHKARLPLTVSDIHTLNLGRCVSPRCCQLRAFLLQVLFSFPYRRTDGCWTQSTNLSTCRAW